MNEIRTLGQLGVLDSTEQTFPALIGSNMGHRTLKLNLSIKELIDRAHVYNAKMIEELGNKPEDNLDAQRPLYKSHANGLAKYIIVGLVDTNIKRAGKVSQRILNLRDQLGATEYSCLQPFVTNIRDCEPDGSDLKAFQPVEMTNTGSKQPLDGVIKVSLSSRHKMSVVDGQHRRYAFDIVWKWLNDISSHRKYPAKGIFNPTDTLNNGQYLDDEIYQFWSEILDIALKESFVSVECHLGATVAQERQIFSDLNSKGKKVEVSQALEYDSSDAVNNFVKDELLGSDIINFGTKIKDSSSWAEDDGNLLRKDLNPISSLVMFGKTSTKTITPGMVKKNCGLAKQYWRAIQKVKGFGKNKARQKTVAAQPVVLKGIAKLAYELAYGKSELKNEQHLKELWGAIESGNLDFSHKNPLWGSLMKSPDERERDFPGISKYVHVPAGTNLDAGTYDSAEGWVRFGSKHNDIFPRIGDLIRYELKFNPRPSVTRSIKKESENVLKKS